MILIVISYSIVEVCKSLGDLDVKHQGTTKTFED